MSLRFCQGTKCHMYFTKDRIKGSKGNKTNQTRRRSNFYYGGNNFCSLNCQNDWFNDFGDRAIDHFGRLTEPKQLTGENAWQKDYDWDWNNGNGVKSNWRFINLITKEQRPITEEQYNDNNYELNT